MAAQQIADLYGSVGFRLDPKAWATLDKFENRLDTIRKKLNMSLTGRLGGGVSGGGSSGGSGRAGGTGRTNLSLAGSALSNIHTIGLAITGGVATTAGKAILDTTAKYDALRSSLLASSDSAEDAKKTFGFLIKESKRLGLVTTEIARPYVNFSVAARAAGLSGNEVNGIFTQMAEASRGLNLTSDDTAGVFRALSQMFSKTTVQSEELKGQLGERLPGAVSLSAKALGITTFELQKQLKAGKVLATDLIPKLAKEYQYLVKKSGSLEAAMKSTGFAMNRMKQEWESLLDRLGSGETGRSLKNLMTEVTTFFEGAGEKGGLLDRTLAHLVITLRTLGVGVGMVVGGLKELFNLFSPEQQAVLVVVGGILAAMFAPVATAVVGLGAFVVAMEDLDALLKGKKSLIGEYLGEDGVAKLRENIDWIFSKFKAIGELWDKYVDVELPVIPGTQLFTKLLPGAFSFVKDTYSSGLNSISGGLDSWKDSLSSRPGREGMIYNYKRPGWLDAWEKSLAERTSAEDRGITIQGDMYLNTDANSAEGISQDVQVEAANVPRN